MSKHTPEPWRANGRKVVSRCTEPNSSILRNLLICQVRGTTISGEPEANAERIASCVNALAGMNPEAVRDVVRVVEVVIGRLICKGEGVPCHELAECANCHNRRLLTEALAKLREAQT